MGNQMLQYALGRHLSIKNNSPLWLDLSWYNNYRKSQFYREFRIDCFQTNYKRVNLNNILWRLRFTDHFKTINPFKLKNVVEKEYAHFDEKILEAGDDILLEGFFPSYKYFEGIREVLIKDFTPIEQMNTANAAYLQKIKSTNSVSVHFRRGDYALTGHHGMLDKAYYEAAIKHIAIKTGGLQLFIFSDEPEWVCQNMQFEHPFEVISINKDQHNYFDMELMKHCKHNIIANSSFSWWGAWLNETTEKIVVAPEKWLNVDINRMENIPPEWILL